VFTGQIGQLPTRYEDDTPVSDSPVHARLLSKIRKERAMREVLGSPYFRFITVLPVVGGGALGPVFGPDGRVLVWSIWAPHRRALLDIFPSRAPSQDELDARAEFAQTHRLKYGVVQPGWQLTIDNLKEWVTT